MYGRVLNLAAPVETGHPLNRGRVAWWYGLPYLSAGQRLRNILSAGQYEGTLVNDPTRAPTNGGDVGLRLNGTNQSVTVAHSPGLAVGSGSFAFAGWIKLDATTGVRSVIDKRVNGGSFLGYSLFVSLGAWGCQLNDTTVRSFLTATPTTNLTRVLWTVDRSANVTTLFFNGVQVSSASIAAVTGTLTQSVTLYMGQATNAASFVQGVMSDWSHWIGSIPSARMDYDQAVRGYRTTDSPLRWLKNTAYFLPSAPAGNRRRRVLITAGGR